MTSHERRPTLEIDEPDIGFQAGFGFYLGLVAAGIAASAGLLAGVTTATLLGVLPTTVTAVAIVGHILAKRARGLPERIGRSRWHRLACYAPPIAFAATLAVPLVAPLEATGRFAVVTVAMTLVTGVAAFGVDRMSRNRYVSALTADEPATTWTWHRTGFGSGRTAFTAIMSLLIVVGLIDILWHNDWGAGGFWAFYGAIMLVLYRTDAGGKWNDFDPSDRWNPPEIRAHEAGLVVDKQFAKTFVPWGDIEAVRLTDDELVLERRWLDLRCDRASIDDPESVLENLERARRGADGTETVATGTDTERKPEAGTEPTTELED